MEPLPRGDQGQGWPPAAAAAAAALPLPAGRLAVCVGPHVLAQPCVAWQLCVPCQGSRAPAALPQKCGRSCIWPLPSRRRRLARHHPHPRAPGLPGLLADPPQPRMGDGHLHLRCHCGRAVPGDGRLDQLERAAHQRGAAPRGLEQEEVWQGGRRGLQLPWPGVASGAGAGPSAGRGSAERPQSSHSPSPLCAAPRPPCVHRWPSSDTRPGTLNIWLTSRSSAHSWVRAAAGCRCFKGACWRWLAGPSLRACVLPLKPVPRVPPGCCADARTIAVFDETAWDPYNTGYATRGWAPTCERLLIYTPFYVSPPAGCGAGLGRCPRARRCSVVGRCVCGVPTCA